MAKYVKINMPLGSPEETLKLTKKVLLKHTALGLASPLNGFVDMTAFSDNLTDAEDHRDNGKAQENLAQSTFHQLEMACGTGKGQNRDTKDTLYWYVQQVRNVLRLKFKGTEEDMQLWGFNVVVSQTGARKNVRIDMPKSKPEEFIDLSEAIIDRHTTLGVASPLVDLVDMTAFETLATSARNLHTAWETARNMAQSYHNQSIVIIGFGAGQTSYTEGTLYFDLCSIRDRLLQVHQGTEEILSEWSFDVVISEAPSGGKGTGSLVAKRQGELAMGIVHYVNFEGEELEPEYKVQFSATTATMRFYGSEEAAVVPGPATVWFDVPAGQSVTKTVGEVADELGLNEVKKYLNVQNVGAEAGSYVVTITR